MERQYFDNTLLAQFYVTKMPLSVYVEGDLLKIVDADDITDPFMGSGMKMSGEMEPFDYRNIEFMMIGKNKFSIEDVNKAVNDFAGQIKYEISNARQDLWYIVKR